MLSHDEQVRHYQAVRQRITRGAKPSFDEPVRPPLPAPPEPKVARMVVPTIEQLDAMPAAVKTQRKADRIVQECAHKHAVSVEAILGAARFRSIMHARREAMYRLTMEMGWSQVRIGRFLNKDHSSVFHAIHVYRKEHNL